MKIKKIITIKLLLELKDGKFLELLVNRFGCTKKNLLLIFELQHLTIPFCNNIKWFICSFGHNSDLIGSNLY